MSARDWLEFEHEHQPEQPTRTRREMLDEAEALELYIDRMETRIRHAGTREAKLGAERNIAQAERELRELRPYIGSRSVVGSVYGSRPGVPEGRIIPQGAADLCASDACRAPISKTEGFYNGGFCNECLWMWLHPEDRDDNDDPTRRR